ncbi:hypothetical protein Tco_0225261 [Tanacetum coccineum]
MFVILAHKLEVSIRAYKTRFRTEVKMAPQGFPSEVHKERLHRRFTRSASIGCSRGAPPSEVHEERLHRVFTRSASIRGSLGAPPSEVYEEHLHRRFTRSASIGGSQSEVYSLEGFDRIPHKSTLFGSTTKAFQAEKTLGFN